MVQVLCSGCGASVKRIGIIQHCHLSQNPACRSFLRDSAKDPESLEAYMQSDDESGMGMTWLLFSSRY